MALMADDLLLISRLLDEALDLPEQERLGWLAARDDLAPELRGRLRELLADGDAGYSPPPLPVYCDAELSDSAEKPGTDANNADIPDATIGPYRLLSELGRGGMGAVWLAERSDGTLKRQVALKLPHVSLPHGQLVERFARERDILADLEHPHIARLYDAGVAENGRPYLAMEYVDGQNLLDYCRDRALDVETRITLFLQVLRAIQYAHSRLIVHRDIKPSNILVTREGDVRLLDFGVAKMLDAEACKNGSSLTEFDHRPLTPEYAAPEQLLGQAIGTGVDIYALGVVLYQLLTGALPHRSKRNTRAAMEDAIVDGVPLQASQAARQTAEFAAWSKLIKGDLDTILSKALKKDAQERYETTAAFADDLTRYLEGQSVLAQSDSFGYRAGKFLRRHRWAVAGTAAVFLSLAIGLGVALWQARVAEQLAETARKEATTSQAVKEFLQDIFLANSAQQADPIKARQTTARELLDIGAEKLEGALADSPDALAEMLWMFAELYSQLLLPDRAAAFAERRLALIRKTHGEDSIELGEALFIMVAAARSAWIDDPRIPGLIDESRRVFARHPELPERHRVVLALSAEYWSDRDFARALREVREAMQVKVDSLTDASIPPMQAAAVELLADDPLRAREDALQALAAEKATEAVRLEGKGAPGDGGMVQAPSILSLLADAYWALDQRDEAIAQGRKALAAARNVFGDTDPDTVRLQARLSFYLRAQGKVPEADGLLAAATATLAEARPKNRTRLRFYALAALGKAQVDAARDRDAVTSLTRALAMRDPAIDASPAIADLLRDLTRAHLALGQRAEATKTLERAIAMREKTGIALSKVLMEEADLRARLASPRTNEPYRQG
jgi:serine/threonine-protein kinase